MHAEGFGVANDRGATQAFEDAELDFVGPQRVELIKAAREAFEVFAGQAGNEVDVQVGLRVIAQPSEVVGCLAVVLLARDALLHFGVEGLDADFELQCAGGKAGDAGFKRFGQVVGHEFEMQEARIVGSRFNFSDEEVKDGEAGFDVEVEGAVNKFEAARAACVERVELGKEGLRVEWPGGLVEGGETEFTFERAAARSFDIERALADVFGTEFAVGQREGIERGLFARVHFHQRLRAVEQLLAQFGESDVAPAGDDMVGALADALLAGLKADFGAAEHDGDSRLGSLKDGDHRLGLAHIPDIDAKADDAWIKRKQRIGNLLRRAADGEFGEVRVGLKRTHIGQQIAQPERGVGIAGVEGGEHNPGHDGIVGCGASRIA